MILNTILFLILFLCACFDGESFLLWSKNSEHMTILREIRLPRTIFSFLVGGVLALSGLVYQSLFKNDLASPFTLGTASMASFGASLCVFLGYSNLINLGALGMCLVGLGAMIFLLKYRERFSYHFLILYGVIVSYFFSSLVMLIQVLSEAMTLREIVIWILGDLNVVGVESVMLMLPGAILFFAYFSVVKKDLAKVAVGDFFALTSGVSVEKVKLVSLVVTTLAVAWTVSLCGPIGFVGIVIPHFVRLIKGGRVDKIGIDVFLWGGFFLSFCEFGAQTLLMNYSIPVGIVTSFVGAPFFIWVLFRRKLH